MRALVWFGFFIGFGFIFGGTTGVAIGFTVACFIVLLEGIRNEM